MLRTYSNNITTEANSPISFNVNKFNTNRSVTHAAGASDIIVRSPNFYNVDFNISFTTADTVSSPVIIQLYANGVAIPDAIIETSVSAAGTYVSGSFANIIKANPGLPSQNVTLTVVPNAKITSASATLTVD